MTTTDGLEWIQNDPLFHTSLVALSEGIDGNGVLSTGDMEITTTANANEIQVATGDLWYSGDSTVYSIGTAETHTLSSNASGDDRWDLVVFDTTLTTPASDVIEGTPAASPEPPLPGAGQVVLGYIYVADGETDVADSVVKNWRMFASDAADVRLDDAAGDYSSTEVESAFTEVIREAGDPLNGPLDLSSFAGSAPFDLGTNPGAFGAIVDAAVDSNAAAGTEESFLFAVDGSTAIKVYAESDGAGGVQNLRVEVPVPLRQSANVEDDRGNVLYDYTANEFTQARLGGPASSLTSYPLVNSDLNYSTITVTAGQNLSGGGSVGLGGSTTVDYSPGELGLPTHHVEYAGGLVDEEIARIQVPTGRQLEVYQLGVELKGGGSDTSVVLDVYDATNAVEIASTTAGTLQSGSLLGTSGDGATVLVRLETGSNGPYTVTTSGVINLGDI